MTVYNVSGVPTGTMQTSKAGRIEISNETGATRVNIGILDGDVGIVRAAGPGGGGVSTAPGMVDSYIKGWSKK